MTTAAASIRPLAPAILQWRTGHDGQDTPTPYSERYADIYHGPDAAGEVRRVFLEPVALDFGADHLVIGELGFGSALNFAVCCQQLLKAGGTHLHFISFEAHPLNTRDWQTLARLRATEFDVYRSLAAHPLPALTGWHRRVLLDGRVTLSVYHGDVEDGLIDCGAAQTRPVDAWLLDGFAPAKNPRMWTADVFAHLAALSRPGTSVTTFTAAGAVRRGLTEAGFRMRKIDQQPFKRESLAGWFDAPRRAIAPPLTVTASPPKAVQVFGAGLAGATVARHLADRGCEVCVHDPNGVASGASQISTAVLHARLLGDASVQADLRVAALHYAPAYLDTMLPPGPDGARAIARSGVTQCPGPNLDAAKLARIAEFYAASSMVEGGENKPADPQGNWLQRVRVNDADALYFPTAGTLDIATACRQLLEHPRIELSDSSASVEFTAQTTPTVVCTPDVVNWPGFDWLEIDSVSGQLDRFYSGERTALKGPLVGSGYVVPQGDELVLGSTYEYAPWAPTRATRHNIELNAAHLSSANLVWIGRQRATRAIASDRTPIVGQLGDNLWIATAFGSMGTTAAPLAAAILTSLICGERPPVSNACLEALHPVRFQRRQARRGRLSRAATPRAPQ